MKIVVDVTAILEWSWCYYISLGYILTDKITPIAFVEITFLLYTLFSFAVQSALRE